MDLKNLVRSIAQDILGEQRMNEEHFEEIYRRIEHKIDNEPPPRFAFIGETGVGKSSTLNALFNAGCEVSHIEACTQVVKGVEVDVDEVGGMKGILLAYDVPGLGESRLKHREHLELYEKVLKEVDVALWILDAQNRAIASVQESLIKIQEINPNLLERIVFALNKVDLVYPGESAWHQLANIPSEEQEKNITGRIHDVKKKIREVIPHWRGTVIGYSANRRYNLPQLFAAMLDAVPKKRQWVVASRKALADFFELVDPQLLPPEKKQNLYQFEQPASSRIQKISDIVESMPAEEFTRLATNKGAFLEWLEYHSK